MNPNLCTICELMFERTMKARTVTIDATVLFADLRAYTQLSQSKSPAEMAGFLDEFYDAAPARSGGMTGCSTRPSATP